METIDIDIKAVDHVSAVLDKIYQKAKSINLGSIGGTGGGVGGSGGGVRAMASMGIASTFMAQTMAQVTAAKLATAKAAENITKSAGKAFKNIPSNEYIRDYYDDDWYKMPTLTDKKMRMQHPDDIMELYTEAYKKTQPKSGEIDLDLDGLKEYQSMAKEHVRRAAAKVYKDSDLYVSQVNQFKSVAVDSINRMAEAHQLDSIDKYGYTRLKSMRTKFMSTISSWLPMLSVAAVFGGIYKLISTAYDSVNHGMKELAKFRDLQYQAGTAAYAVRPSNMDAYAGYRQQLAPLFGISDVDKAAAMAVDISKKSSVAAQEYIRLMEVLSTIGSVSQKTDISKLEEYKQAVFGTISNSDLRDRLTASLTSEGDVTSLEDRINAIYGRRYGSPRISVEDQMTDAWSQISKSSAETYNKVLGGYGSNLKVVFGDDVYAGVGGMLGTIAGHVTGMALNVAAIAGWLGGDAFKGYALPNGPADAIDVDIKGLVDQARKPTKMTVDINLKSPDGTIDKKSVDVPQGQTGAASMDSFLKDMSH